MSARETGRPPDDDARPGAARISPTAFYTGHAWVRNGLAGPAFFTRRGQLLFHTLQPLIRVCSRLNGGLTPEVFLLQRHKLLDHLLRSAVEGGVHIVIEIGCGLSPRGVRFRRAFGDRLTYVEADLPDMALRKRSLLERAGLLAPGHEVVPLDALASDGPLSVREALAPRIRGRRAALLTEGLVNYFPRGTLLELWATLASLLRAGGGVYLTDLHVLSATPSDAFARVWRRMIRLFARGGAYVDFADERDAEEALVAAGFSSARAHDPGDYTERLGLPCSEGGSVVRILEGRREVG